MLVTKINDITSHMKEIDFSDTSRDSSQAPKRDYTLEFVQTICAVMALDQNVEQDVLVTPLIPFSFYLILILLDNHIE